MMQLKILPLDSASEGRMASSVNACGIGGILFLLLVLYWKWLFSNCWQVYDRGNQTRSFQYVSDLVSGLISLMNSNYSRPINLGNPREYSINELAQIINQLTGMW